MINVGINQASAVMRVPYGIFQTSPDAQALMGELMREVIALAQCAGVNLKEQDLNDWHAVPKPFLPKARRRCCRTLRQDARPKLISLPERWSIWERVTVSQRPLTRHC